MEEQMRESGGAHGHANHGHGGHRTHKFDPANVARLLSEERQQLIPPRLTLEAAGIGPGQTVVDLGCGPGFFTVPAAQLVGAGGRVYGVDLQAELLDICRTRAAEAGLTQVETVQSAESSVPLPDGFADRVFIAFVVHEAEDQEAFLGEARRLLKPSGQVAIVEWQKKEDTPGPQPGHRIAPEDVSAMASGAGLRVLESRALNDHHYLVRLTPK